MVNYKEIITKEQFDKMEQEKYEYAVKEGIFHDKYLTGHFSSADLKTFVCKRAKEIALLGSKYRGESKEFKLLLASNIVLPNNTKIIQILLSRNITYNKLAAYSKLISGLHQLASQASDLEIGSEVTIANKKVNNLCSLFKMYFGISDYNLTVIKLNEIVSRQKDLYLSLESEQKEKVH